MNPTLALIDQHRVYREFDPNATISDANLTAIIHAAQRAPSWMNGQHYSMINVSDPAQRQAIVELQPKNPQIGQCSVFLVFVIDGYRAFLANQSQNQNQNQNEGVSFAGFADADTLITLTTDAAMAAQNATLAAESLGYATCPIGGLRQAGKALIDLLALPKYTYPIFGLCIGTPAVDMPIKPRLPMDAVFFDNRYQTDALPKLLAQYEQTMLEFGEAREKLPYRQKFAQFYRQPYVAEGEAWLKSQGFLDQ